MACMTRVVSRGIKHQYDAGLKEKKRGIRKTARRGDMVLRKQNGKNGYELGKDLRIRWGDQVHSSLRCSSVGHVCTSW